MFGQSITTWSRQLNYAKSILLFSAMFGNIAFAQVAGTLQIESKPLQPELSAELIAIGSD